MGALDNYMLSKDGRGGAKKKRHTKKRRKGRLTHSMVGGKMSTQEAKVASATKRKGY